MAIEKHYQQSTNSDPKLIATVFSIAICHQWGDKWQSKKLFILIFDLRSSIELAFLIAAYPMCFLSALMRIHRLIIYAGVDPGFLERGFIYIKVWGFALLILSHFS